MRNQSTLDQAIQAAREEEQVRISMEESRRFYEYPNKQPNTKNVKTKPSMPCFHCGKAELWARDRRSKQQQPVMSVPKDIINLYPRATVNTIICNYYQKPGHMKDVCRKLKLTLTRNRKYRKFYTEFGKPVTVGQQRRTFSRGHKNRRNLIHGIVLTATTKQTLENNHITCQSSQTINQTILLLDSGSD